MQKEVGYPNHKDRSVLRYAQRDPILPQSLCSNKFYRVPPCPQKCFTQTDALLLFAAQRVSATRNSRYATGRSYLLHSKEFYTALLTAIKEFLIGCVRGSNISQGGIYQNPRSVSCEMRLRYFSLKKYELICHTYFLKQYPSLIFLQANIFCMDFKN